MYTKSQHWKSPGYTFKSRLWPKLAISVFEGSINVMRLRPPAQ